MISVLRDDVSPGITGLLALPQYYPEYDKYDNSSKAASAKFFSAVTC